MTQARRHQKGLVDIERGPSEEQSGAAVKGNPNDGTTLLYVVLGQLSRFGKLLVF